MNLESEFSPERLLPDWSSPSVPPAKLDPLPPISGIRHLPCFDSHTLFAGSPDGAVAAFSLKTGQPLWQNHSLAAPRYQSDLAPILCGDVVYVSSAGVLYGLEKTSGSIISAVNCGLYLDFSLCLFVDVLLVSPFVSADWTATVAFFRRGESQPYQTTRLRSGPTGSAATRDTLAIAQSKGSLAIFDLPTGRMRWEWDAAAFHSYPDPVEKRLMLPGKIIGGPILFGELVVVGVEGNLLVALDCKTGAVRWRNLLPVLNPSNLAVDHTGKFLVLDGDHLCAGEVASGELTASFSIPPTLLRLSTRLFAAEGLVWCNDIQSGNLLGFSLETGQLLFQQPIGAPVPQSHYPLYSQSRHMLLVLDANSTLHRFHVVPAT